MPIDVGNDGYCTAADVQQLVSAPGQRMSAETIEMVEGRIREAFREINEVLREAGYIAPIQNARRTTMRDLRTLNVMGAAAKATQNDALIQAYAGALAEVGGGSIEIAADKAAPKPPKAKKKKKAVPVFKDIVETDASG